MKPFETEDELGAALREMRPAPEEDFAAELDAWAAAGFPRRPRPGPASGFRERLASLREHLASTPPRRYLVPAGGLAVVAIAVATAVLATTDGGDSAGRESNGGFLSLTVPADGSSTDDGAESGMLAEPAGRAAGGGESSTSAGGDYEGAAPLSSSAAGAAPSSSVVEQAETGPYASQAGRRDVERSAEIVLGADPADVRADSAKVFDAVHAAGGIVLNSSIRDGEAGTAGADFELLIPSAKLGDALADFSRIGEVRSRHEATQDITAPTVTTGERLRDANARIESLLGELADADTETERTAVEAQLRSERYRAAALRSRLSSLQRRANLSRVQLRIETGTRSSSSSEDGAGGAWGIGDGIDGAGRILAIAAGVAVIGLAVLAPFALIALLVWLTRRAWIRRARRTALTNA